MLVVMDNHATPEQINRVVKTIEEMGYAARPMPGETRTTIGLVGNDGRVDGTRGGENLFFRFDRAGTGDDDDLGPAK